MKDSLGDRMKGYEQITNYYLIRRMPVIIRLDMCHGHTFTKGFVKPFDSVFMRSMQDTMFDLCKEIQGCVFGYTQSDEITLVLVDYQNYDTSAWFDNRVQKICSVSAALASKSFNRAFEKKLESVDIAFSVFSSMSYKNLDRWLVEKEKGQSKDLDSYSIPNENDKIFTKEELLKLFNCYKRSCEQGAVFDSRVFNVPKEDVCNCLIWRQKDAERNSIQSLAQSMYKHREIMGISCKDLQDKMFTERGVNWNNLETRCKRGVSCIKDMEGKWFIDYDMPILTQERDYIERLIYI